MKAKNFGLAWITVSDLEKSKKFFTETLGLVLKEYDENYGWMEFEAQEGGARVGVGKYIEEYAVTRPGQNAVMTFTVDNVRAATEDLKKKGVKLLGEAMEIPGEVIMQTFADNDGNIFQLVELLRKS